MSDVVAVLLYPGCSFFEIALATETLAARFRIVYLTPDGADGPPHRASNGARIVADGGYDGLMRLSTRAVLVPGGDPESILAPSEVASAALRAQADRGALVAGICAGNLVIAAAGLLRGRRGTHNYTAAHAPPDKVAATARYWQGMVYEHADVVEDGAVVTAQPWAYRRYAATVARRLGLFDEAQARALETYPTRGMPGRGAARDGRGGR